MPLHVSRHPLAAHFLAGLRDRHTGREEFRDLARRIVSVLLLEATANLPIREGSVSTPLGEAEARRVAAEVVAVPVLRAGLGILGPVLELLPQVSVGYLGLERDEETHEARIYYQKLPRLAGKVPLLLDPMLATGGSAVQAVNLIKQAGGGDVRMICVVSAPEGVAALEASHPEVEVYAAALDDHLDENAFIVPGLGDFGDRLFGTP